MPQYSPSRLQTFESCPLKYKLRYVDRIKRNSEGIEAFLGNRVHETFEKLYRDLAYRKCSSLDELLAYYEAAWNDMWHDEIKITRQDYAAKNYYDVGVDCISLYYRRYQPFNHGKTVGIEKKLSTVLGGSGTYRVTGIADRIDKRGDGRYEIHDYKTSASLPTQEQMDSDRQLALYQLMLENTWDDVNDVQLVWHYVAFDEELRSTRTPEELEAVATQTVELIEQIERAHDEEHWPAGSSGLCDWCDYPDLCPKRKHSVRLENLEKDQYLQDDGVELADEYAKCHTTHREAKAALERIKEAVLVYAGKHGLELIQGSNHQLAVTTSTRFRFPRKSEAERERLEQLLREMGKWEEVSTLDGVALASIIQGGHWPEDLLRELQAFHSKEQSHSVTVSKLKERKDKRG